MNDVNAFPLLKWKVEIQSFSIAVRVNYWRIKSRHTPMNTSFSFILDYNIPVSLWWRSKFRVQLSWVVSHDACKCDHFLSCRWFLDFSYDCLFYIYNIYVRFTSHAKKPKFQSREVLLLIPEYLNPLFLNWIVLLLQDSDCLWFLVNI